MQTKLKFQAGVPLLCLALGALSASAFAQSATKITIVSTHPVVAPTEEVMAFAVPTQLGYFREEGIEATMQMASSASQAAHVVQSGQAQFASSQPESVLQVREQGGDLVAFFTLKLNNGSKIYVLPDSGIRRLEDLKSKTIGALSWGSGAGLGTRRMLSEVGIAPGEYKAIASGTGPAALLALQNKNIDALVMWEAMYAAAENTGIKLHAIDLPIQSRTAGFSMITSDSYIKANPKIVEGFCRAMAKGYHFASTNPEAAIKLYYKQFPSAQAINVAPEVALRNDTHVLTRFLEMSLEGMPVGAKMGEQKADRWAYTAKVFKEEGVLKGTAPTEQGYTNQFFEACNKFDRDAVAAAARNYK
jgi:NitT/TauT family transport system substrate-binding protein